MTGKEFVEKYNLHDSLIDRVDICEEGSLIILWLDFAFWMQTGYHDCDPETGTLKVSFTNVSNYEIPDDVDWNEISILEATIENNAIKLALLNDVTDQYLEIVISASEVEAEVMNDADSLSN